MTDRTTPQEASRAAFEASSIGRQLVKVREDDDSRYVSMDTEFAWIGWQAATQARDAEVERLRGALQEITDEADYQLNHNKCRTLHWLQKEIETAREALKEQS